MILIYRSKHYSFYQCDQQKCYYIDFGQKIVQLPFCQLLALRAKLSTITIANHFLSEENHHGFEVLQFCNKEHLFILNSLEIIDLTELIENSLIILGVAAPNPLALLELT